MTALVLALGGAAVWLAITQMNRTPALADVKASYLKSDRSYAAAGFEGIEDAAIAERDVTPECVEQLETHSVLFRRFDSADEAAAFAQGNASSVRVRDIVITYTDATLSDDEQDQVEDFTGSLWGWE